MTDEARRDALFAALWQAYDRVPSAKRVQMYKRALADLSYQDLARAVARVIKSSAFVPTIADIRHQVEPSIEDAALVAWSGLLQAASDVGAYSSLVCEDPHVAAAVEVVFGSWPQFCQSDEREVSFRQKEFAAAYRQARRDAAHDGRLRGICDRDGHAIEGVQSVGVLSTTGAVCVVQESKVAALVERHARRAIALESLA